MTLRASTIALASLTLTASLLAMGCASTDGAADPETENAEASDEDLKACNSSPREYFATLRDGQTCAEIPGRRGAWVPQPLFADAPDEVNANMCRYVWRGERYSRGDQEAIRTMFPLLSSGQALTPACGAASKAHLGEVDQVESLDIIGYAGANGCDVCGRVRNGRLWVVLPPERTRTRQFALQLDNGQSRFFEIAPSGARAMSIALPPPPAGARYQSGTVAIY